ncbi:MAG: plasmid replication initiator RepA [Deltaproteobacteria bacterium]|nr:plasmid replication initiator RepA [Deltaproteobacteria bacterium]TLN02297.1 MAG: plasmid replication initiator RepA [bacterium]
MKKDAKGAAKQLDLFVADILTWSPKADRHSLEHPFFSLSKRKDLKIRNYESPDGTVKLEVTPSVKGMATIWDKDVIIYTVSVLREAIQKGERPERNAPVNITAYNLLMSTNRGSGGKSYEDLECALDRLKGTVIKTNIPTGGSQKTEGFGIIEKYKILRDSKTNRMISVELVLSDWLWDLAVTGDKELLAINREYFEITGGVERRLYEMSRKHCGYQKQWEIGLQKLHKKSGSASSIREFRRMIREIVKRDSLPDYSISFDSDKDMLTVRNRVQLP